MRGIDDQNVDAGGNQRFGALVGVGAGPERRADAQLTELVLAGIRVLGRFQDVLDRDESLELELVVHNENTLEPVAMHEALGVLELGALGDGDQLVALGHDIGHRLIEIGLETQVAIGHDANDLAPVENRQSRDPVLSGQRQHVVHGHGGRDRDRVLDHAALETLDLGHLGRLGFRGHVLVHDAHPAFLGDGDGEAGFGYRVHCRRQQRNVQRNARGKAGLEADVAGNDSGVGREQQDVVKSEGFLNDTHRAFLLCAKTDYTRVDRTGKRRRRSAGRQLG